MHFATEKLAQITEMKKFGKRGTRVSFFYSLMKWTFANLFIIFIKSTSTYTPFNAIISNHNSHITRILIVQITSKNN